MLFNSPSEVELSPIYLAGLLTCASSNLVGLPRNLIPVTIKCHVLNAYSYGVVTDSHRLPEHQILDLYRSYGAWVNCTTQWWGLARLRSCTAKTAF
jgi:hypothetical protein